MYLNSESFNIVGAIGSSGEVGKVELDLIPSVVESHRHCADEGLYASSRLVVASSESPSDVLIIQNLKKLFLVVSRIDCLPELRR
jgi:hypothetical protein